MPMSYDIKTLRKHLPDPYAYERDYFEVLVPMDIPDLDVDNISETGPGPKVALFKKISMIDAKRRRTHHWELVRIT